VGRIDDRLGRADFDGYIDGWRADVNLVCAPLLALAMVVIEVGVVRAWLRRR
jgi:hypothetical protein